jgi:hypothetical protein
MAGANVKDTQAQMRHSRATTTLEVYQQFIPESQRRVVNKLTELTGTGFVNLGLFQNLVPKCSNIRAGKGERNSDKGRRINEITTAAFGPEKAGVGDSTLSLATISLNGSNSIRLVPDGGRASPRRRFLRVGISREFPIQFLVLTYEERLREIRRAPTRRASYRLLTVLLRVSGLSTFRAKGTYPRRFKSWLERRKTKPTPQNGRDSAAPQSPEDSIDDIDLPKGTAVNIED